MTPTDQQAGDADHADGRDRFPHPEPDQRSPRGWTSADLAGVFQIRFVSNILDPRR